MSTKVFLILFTLASLTICFNCQKKTESITGFNEDDTSNNGGPIVRKPNIYIYPTQQIELNVKLNFPCGGKILDSAPKYLNGWNIQVDPLGIINNYYTYLFYEARIPEVLQRKNGWIVKGKNLEKFFERNLNGLLFSEKEISDFLGYWMPLLKKDKTYVIYPHYTRELSKIIDINFSVQPDNIIRVLYLIEEYNNNSKVQTPQIPVYKREGFTVLEWGVVYQ